MNKTELRLLKLLKQYELSVAINGGKFDLNGFMEWLADRLIEEKIRRF